MNAPNRPAMPLSTVGLLTAIFVSRGIIMACVLPPFEGWDEYQHAGYIDHCAHSDAPAIYQETFLDAGFTRAVAAFPLPKDALTQPIGAVGYQAYWENDARPAPATAPTGFYESQHPFLYYRMMSPIYRLCGGRDNLALTVSVLRLINLGFAATAILLLLFWVRKNLPIQAGFLASCCITFQPILLLNSVRIANDALAFLLGTIVVLLCISIGSSSPFRRSAALLGLVLPLAVLAKATNLALLPLVVLAYAMRVMDKRGKRAATIAAMLATTVIFIAMTGSHFAFNLRHFGELTPMQEAVANHQAHRTLLSIIAEPPIQLWPIWTWCLWVRNALWVGGWSFLQIPRIISGTYEIMMAIGITALGMQLLRRKLILPGHSLVILVSMMLLVQTGLMYHAIESYSAWSGQVTTNPWYAAVAIPWFFGLICTALVSLPLRRAGVLLSLSIPLIDIVAEITGVWSKMLPLYYQGRTLTRMSQLHPLTLGPVTLSASLCIYAALLILIIRGIRLHTQHRIAS